MTVEQTGTAQVPASVSTDTATASLPVPAGSTVIVDPAKPNVLEIRLVADSILKTEVRKEEAKAPQAFTPPAPPTPSDEAEAKVRFWLWVGLVAGAGAAAFGLVRNWDFVGLGGAAVSAACAFGIFAQRHPVILVIIGAGTLLALVGPYFYHRYLKPKPQPTP